MSRQRSAALVRPYDDVIAYESAQMGATSPALLRREDRRLIRLGGGLGPDDPPVIDGVIQDGTAFDQLLQHFNDTGEIKHSASMGTFRELPNESAPFHDQRVMQYLTDATNGGAATLTNVGFPAAPTLDGTLANVDDTGGAWLRLTSADVLGSNSGLTTPFTYVWPDWEPTLEVKVRTGSSIANTRYWIALTSATVDGATNPAGHHAGFRFDPTLDVNQWRICAKDGTTQTTSFGAAPAGITTSGIYLMQIAVRAGQIIYTINGIEVGRLTANLPLSGQPLGIQVRCRKLDAAGSGGKFIRLGRVALLHH